MDTNDTEWNFGEGLEKMAGMLGETAARLTAFAKTLEPNAGETEGLNAGKTEEEIALEEAFAAKVAAPIVDVLDGLSAIINEATAKVAAMNGEDGNR